MNKTKKITPITNNNVPKPKATRTRSILQPSLLNDQPHPPSSPSPLHKHILLEFDNFTQLLQQVNLTPCITPTTRTLSIKRLLTLLQKTYSIFTKDKLIKFYLQQGAVYLTIPTSKKALSLFEIQEGDYRDVETIKLQLLKNREIIDCVMEDGDSGEESGDAVGEEDEDAEADGDQKALQGKCRRLKERKIKHVIQKVLKWRQLYAPENGNQNQKVSLEEGAKIVKISKKTLDDYLSQLKKGKKYGFNFNDHKNQKIGVLRQFIRKMEKKR